MLSLLNLNIQLHFCKQTAYSSLPRLSPGRQYRLEEYTYTKKYFINNYAPDMQGNFDQNHLISHLFARF